MQCRRADRHDQIDGEELPTALTNANSATALRQQLAPISMTGRGPNRAIASLMKTTTAAVSR